METVKVCDLKYSGSTLLHTGERTLKNYNKWIVSKFVGQYRALGAKSVLDFGAGIGSLCECYSGK